MWIWVTFDVYSMECVAYELLKGYFVRAHLIDFNECHPFRPLEISFLLFYFLLDFLEMEEVAPKMPKIADDNNWLWRRRRRQPRSFGDFIYDYSDSSLSRFGVVNGCVERQFKLDSMPYLKWNRIQMIFDHYRCCTQYTKKCRYEPFYRERRRRRILRLLKSLASYTLVDFHRNLKINRPRLRYRRTNLNSIDHSPHSSCFK